MARVAAGPYSDGMKRRVVVSGSGSAGAAPDVVRVQVGVRCDGVSVAAALGAAAQVVQAIGESARRAGLADRDLSTTTASVQPRWDPQGGAIVGYTAYHQLVVTVRELGDLNPVVTSLAESAGNALSIDLINLEIADLAPLRRQAREAAFADALTKAQQYAALAGRSLGAVVEVVEAAGAGMPMPYAGRKMLAMSAGDAAGLPVESGEHTVSASVQVSWELTGPTD